MKTLLRLARNQRGQAMIELGLMLPLFAIIIMFLLITYELSSKLIQAQENLRHDMRVSIDRNSSGSFRPNMKSRQVSVSVPGRMKQWIGAPFIQRDLDIHFYEGCYYGLGDSYYRKKYLYREIDF